MCDIDFKKKRKKKKEEKCKISFTFYSIKYLLLNLMIKYIFI